MRKPAFRFWLYGMDSKTRRDQKNLNRLWMRAKNFQQVTVEELRLHQPDAELASALSHCGDHDFRCSECSEGCPLGKRCLIGQEFMALRAGHPVDWFNITAVLAHPDDRVRLGALRKLKVKPVLRRLRSEFEHLNDALGPFAVAAIIAPEVRVGEDGQAYWQLVTHLAIAHPVHPDQHGQEYISRVLTDGHANDDHILSWGDDWSFWSWECIAPIPFGVHVRFVVGPNGESVRHALPLEGAAAAEYTLWLDAFPEATRLFHMDVGQLE